MTELDEIDEMAGTTKGDQEMTDGKCPRCGASLHFNYEIGMFCPACAQRRDAFQVAWEATRRDANEAAKQRRASDIALAATEAERVARALRGEQMPPPFAVCEGHAERLAALEASVAALWQAMEVQEAHDVSPRLARLESYANELEAAFGALADGTPVDEARAAFERAKAEDDRACQKAWSDSLALSGWSDPVEIDEPPTPTLCPAVTRVEVRDHFGRCLFFAAPANDVDLRYSDDGKTLTVVLRR
jgi:uncharacterized Zn finger protein (UPF0148 family)